MNPHLFHHEYNPRTIIANAHLILILYLVCHSFNRGFFCLLQVDKWNYRFLIKLCHLQGHLVLSSKAVQNTSWLSYLEGKAKHKPISVCSSKVKFLSVYSGWKLTCERSLETKSHWTAAWNSITVMSWSFSTYLLLTAAPPAAGKICRGWDIAVQLSRIYNAHCIIHFAVPWQVAEMCNVVKGI